MDMFYYVTLYLPLVLLVIFCGFLLVLIKKVLEFWKFIYYSRVVSETYSLVSSTLPFAYMEMVAHEDYKIMNDREKIDWICNSLENSANASGIMLDPNVSRAIVKANHNLMMRMVNSGQLFGQDVL